MLLFLNQVYADLYKTLITHDNFISDMKPNSVSNEMLTLYEAQCRAHETVLALQAQIEEEESVYFEETPHGNIIRGWDGFIDSKQPRKDANLKKIKPYTDSEHLFSSCCLYSSMASEPSIDQVDIYGSIKDENITRPRKLTVTLSVGKGTGTAGSISGVVDSAAAPHSTNAVYNGTMVPKTSKTPVTHLVTGKEAAASSYQNSKASKLMKRKREAEAAAAVTARLHETVSTNMPTINAVTTSTTTTVAVQPPASDFLDVL
ncbi:unnamed protein product [Peronospora farinosa]|uniref:Chromatin modification-related protein MEAF6 n=1 Tax=Peronospora farinosa TaxID=134698 RepID=A0AAV0U484_9STRA|nr:unnamed protein product [Peronospora farinosa]CAI5731579.1 unnamed protein product [Peronospora farinosa]